MGPIPFLRPISIVSQRMGNTLRTHGFARGPGGTTFMGDMAGRACYGLPLESHPVQIIPKRDASRFIANRIYPLEGEAMYFAPRQYHRVPWNDGNSWNSWRFGGKQAPVRTIYIYFTVLLFFAIQGSAGGKFNRSWRGEGASLLHGSPSDGLATASEKRKMCGGMAI